MKEIKVSRAQEIKNGLPHHKKVCFADSDHFFGIKNDHELLSLKLTLFVTSLQKSVSVMETINSATLTYHDNGNGKQILLHWKSDLSK